MLEKNRKILLVDDDEAIRHSLSLYLRLKGYHCDTCVNGEEGLQAWKDLAPDILLVDYRMPKMNGADLIARVRESDPNIPIILCSADKYLSALDLSTAAVRIIKKPFNLNALTEVIEQALEKARLG